MDSALQLVKCAGNVKARTTLRNSVLLQQMVTQMVESGRDEEECLLISVGKIGRKLLAVLSVSGK